MRPLTLNPRSLARHPLTALLWAILLLALVSASVSCGLRPPPPNAPAKSAKTATPDTPTPTPPPPPKPAAPPLPHKEARLSLGPEVAILSTLNWWTRYENTVVVNITMKNTGTGRLTYGLPDSTWVLRVESGAKGEEVAAPEPQFPARADLSPNQSVNGNLSASLSQKEANIKLAPWVSSTGKYLDALALYEPSDPSILLQGLNSLRVESSTYPTEPSRPAQGNLIGIWYMDDKGQEIRFGGVPLTIILEFYAYPSRAEAFNNNKKELVSRVTRTVTKSMDSWASTPSYIMVPFSEIRADAKKHWYEGTLAVTVITTDGRRFEATKDHVLLY